MGGGGDEGTTEKSGGDGVQSARSSLHGALLLNLQMTQKIGKGRVGDKTFFLLRERRIFSLPLEKSGY